MVAAAQRTIPLPTERRGDFTISFAASAPFPVRRAMPRGASLPDFRYFQNRPNSLRCG